MLFHVHGTQKNDLIWLQWALSSKSGTCPSRSATCHPPHRCGSEGSDSLSAPAEQALEVGP